MADTCKAHGLTGPHAEIIAHGDYQQMALLLRGGDPSVASDGWSITTWDTADECDNEKADLRARLGGEETTAPCRRPLGAFQTEWREGKFYSVRVSRCDGKHLTIPDYQWIRERLGIMPDDAPKPTIYPDEDRLAADRTPDQSTLIEAARRVSRIWEASGDVDDAMQDLADALTEPDRTPAPEPPHCDRSRCYGGEDTHVDGRCDCACHRTTAPNNATPAKNNADTQNGECDWVAEAAAISLADGVDDGEWGDPLARGVLIDLEAGGTYSATPGNAEIDTLPSCVGTTPAEACRNLVEAVRGEGTGT